MMDEFWKKDDSEFFVHPSVEIKFVTRDNESTIVPYKHAPSRHIKGLNC